MTNDEIKAGSKLLAEFEGACFPENPTNQYDSTFLYKDGNRWKQVDKLTYHTDYNELMRVVEKIKELGYDFEVQNNSVTITSFAHLPAAQCISHSNEKDLKESIYNAAVQFVTWYNSLKPKDS